MQSYLRGAATLNEAKGSSSSPSTSISGIFNPQFSMRNRTMTEDAVLARNMKDDFQELLEKKTIDASNDDTSDDEASTISSVTDASFRKRLKKRLGEEDPNATFPPREILISFYHPSKGRLLNDKSLVPLARLNSLSASVGSPRLRRPSVPRSQTNKQSRLSLIRETPSVFARGYDHSEAESSVADPQLLGDRPKFYRRQTSHLSIGSFVGQSSSFDLSMNTAPETSCASSDFSTRRSLPLKNVGSMTESSLSPISRPRTQIISRTTRKVMKRELKQMLNRVATPLRRSGKNEETSDLQRSKGFLT